MFTFTPIDGDRTIANVQMTIDELHELRNTLQMALDYNPSTSDFVQAMQPARVQLGPAAWASWMISLQKIRTEGECEGKINFMFEDWISSWRVSDFIDRTWTCAKVSRVWADQAERDLEE